MSGPARHIGFFLAQHLSLLAVSAVVGLAGCSGSQPILYPDSHFKTVGREAAERDIDECKKSAEAAGAEPGAGQAGEVAGSTAVGAGIGAAGGAVGGAVVGAAGSGSAIGAASGAVWGLLTGLWHAFTDDGEPNQTYRRFVDRCLKEKGYEVVGWE
ncbi:MAG: glycine zipper family protein [Nitrospirota bacterium]